MDNLHNISQNAKPVVMALAPLDPAGRRGLQAMIETIGCKGGHCAAIATGVFTTTADSSDVGALDSSLLIQQARSVLEDMPVAALTLGYASSVANLEAIHSIISDYRHIPLVVCSAMHTREHSAANPDYASAFADLIAGTATVLVADNRDTSNLTGNAAISEQATHRLLALDCEHALTYQCQSSKRCFDYTLYREDTVLLNSDWQLDGCQPQSPAIEDMITAGIATQLAHGSNLTTAVQEALSYAGSAAAGAQRIGFESLTPDRYYWANAQSRF